MTVLSIPEIVELSKNTSKGNPLEILFNDELAEERMVEIKKLVESFEESAANGKALILNSIPEKDFVLLARAAQNTVLTAMVTNGKIGLLETHMNGELTGYTHTVVLSIIGILFNEGVL